MTLPSDLALSPGLRVADLGCGRGELCAELHDAVSPGGLVVGFDLDEEQLAVARRLRRPGLRFEPGDACDLSSVPDDSFDRVVCRKLLIHLSRPIEALQEMVRIARPGGLVVAVEPDELAARLAWWDSASVLDPALPALRAEVHARVVAGAREVGGGDRRLGPALPALFVQAGLEQPRLSLDPAAPHQPGPPDDLDLVLARLDGVVEAPVEEDLFLAAGGRPELWAAWQRAERAASRERRVQVRQRTFAAGVPELLYTCSARVPDGVSSAR